MKIALTVWDGWISPVFDVCREAMIFEIDAGQIASSTKVDMDGTTPLQKIDRLLGLGAETLICGAISEAVHAEAAPRGLKVIGFVAGEIDQVMQAFLSDGLATPALSMPGCKGIRRRSRGQGRGQGNGQGKGQGKGQGRGRGKGQGCSQGKGQGRGRGQGQGSKSR